MKEIALTQNQVALVDDADYEMLAQRTWCAHRPGKSRTFYAVTNMKVDGKWLVASMHRLLLGFPPKPLVVDHINLNGLDNRRCNLRLVTQYVNNNNRPRKSGYYGVTPTQGKFQAQIWINGVCKFLGLHPTAIDAARVFDEHAVKVHGADAILNFPEEK